LRRCADCQSSRFFLQQQWRRALRERQLGYGPVQRRLPRRPVQFLDSLLWCRQLPACLPACSCAPDLKRRAHALVALDHTTGAQTGRSTRSCCATRQAPWPAPQTAARPRRPLGSGPLSQASFAAVSANSKPYAFSFFARSVRPCARRGTGRAPTTSAATSHGSSGSGGSGNGESSHYR
jgi:hypothetical protein